jgi:hypothetical protein
MDMNQTECRKKMWDIVKIGVIAFFISLFIKHFSRDIGNIFLIIALIFTLSGTVYGLINLKCPFCKGSLNIRGHDKPFCPHCGGKIL